MCTTGDTRVNMLTRVWQGRSFGFLVINVCNHGEHYETPCINRADDNSDKSHDVTTNFHFQDTSHSNRCSSAT